MNFRKNRESRGLLIYSEPHTKVKKVSDKKVPKPRDFTEGGKIAPNANGFLTIPRHYEDGEVFKGKEPQADTIINQ